MTTTKNEQLVPMSQPVVNCQKQQAYRWDVIDGIYIVGKVLTKGLTCWLIFFNQRANSLVQNLVIKIIKPTS